MGNRHGNTVTGVSGLGSQGGDGSVRGTYVWDEEGGGIYRPAGATGGGGNVGAIYGPGSGGGGGNVGAVYGPRAIGRGSMERPYGAGERSDGSVVAAAIYGHDAGEGSNYRGRGSLRGNIGAIYAPGARNTGGNMDEIFLPRPQRQLRRM